MKALFERRERAVEVPLTYCSHLLVYSRRPTREVRVGKVGIGGSNPVRIQSMLTSDTRDAAACVREALELAEAGCEIVRITAQTRVYAEYLRPIRDGIRAAGCDVPLVADIHFKPDAALEAAKWVEKVRINPGNYADAKKFRVREYSDEQYEAELERVADRFRPLVRLCRERGVAMRIGTNHGSLSDRIMNRFGDTPLGMVESALEFARTARAEDYHDFIFSMKASNPKVMIEAYRLLAARLDALGPGWSYPIHLGVTEAGDGEDGRIKSAIGIGALLDDGIGDTIRVSLTEDSVREIPVARALADSCGAEGMKERAEERTPNGGKALPAAGGCSGIRRSGLKEWSGPLPAPFAPSWDPFSYARRPSERMEIAGIGVGGEETVRVAMSRAGWEKIAHKLDRMGDYQPEIVYEESGVEELDPRDDAAVEGILRSREPRLITVADGLPLPPVAAFRLLAARIAGQHPVLLKDTLWPEAALGGDFLSTLLHSSRVLGSLLCDGIGDAVLVRCEDAPGQSLRLAYNILQAAGARIFKTDYVACPSCGRTLFNLQATTARIREATGHLKGLRIAIMGCIVNGPGEMADADFGYVGGAPGKINLYVGKRPVEFNIPEGRAVESLIDLIRAHGKWVDP
ncbi:MAG TPA: (E)-4-hydroxy-3-methylbut-2-enyl-diphosphate synthase [Verrucomicrobiales bacterium]|nr:(E)-4-hydroxy-3-methylbut-2-enyl-diphosphate synthase [Verrucomicrobiales bacterium]